MIVSNSGNAGLFAALAAVGASLAAVARDSAVDTGRYKHRFASLNAILETCKPVLSKHGLAILQMPACSDGVVTVTTMVTHTDGGYISTDLSVPVGKADAQAIGSAITYARRYALRSILAIGEDDEDDGTCAVAAVRAASRNTRDRLMSELSKLTTVQELTAFGKKAKILAEGMGQEDADAVRTMFSDKWDKRVIPDDDGAGAVAAARSGSRNIRDRLMSELSNITTVQELTAFGKKAKILAQGMDQDDVDAVRTMFSDKWDKRVIPERIHHDDL